MSETLMSTPGFVVDVFLMKRDYDDVMHGIKRVKMAEWGED